MTPTQRQHTLESVENIGNSEAIIIGKYIKIIVDCRQNYGDAMKLGKLIKTAVNSHEQLVSLLIACKDQVDVKTLNKIEQALATAQKEG